MKKIYILLLSLIIVSTAVSQQSVSDMLEDAISSVVTVGVFKTDYAKHALGFRGETAPEMAYEKALDLAGATGSGSGFIIKKDGKYYVITNAHVIESASEEDGSIYVFTVNRTKYEVKLVGGDSFYDVAVLEFVDNPGSEISTIRFRDTDVRLGEKVFAIGNPLGEYPYSVTDGIISAKNRVRGGMTGKFGFLQTTATLIWGNSGGPLVDANGEVAGINSQIAFANTADGQQILQSQINFALEAEISKRIVNDIITNDGVVKRAFFGLELSQKYGYQYNYNNDPIPVRIDDYPVISGVIPGSPAYAKLSDKIGWVVTKINNENVKNIEEALGEFEKVRPGKSITMQIENDYSKQTVSLKSEELIGDRLEDLSRFILDQNSNIVVDYDNPSVVFSINNNNSYKYSEKELYRYNMEGKKAASDNYYILAAGIYNENAPNIWLIENYVDLGSVLKLTGTAGVLDMYVLKEGAPVEDIELLRQYLSGDEDVIKSTIWY